MAWSHVVAAWVGPYVGVLVSISFNNVIVLNPWHIRGVLLRTVERRSRDLIILQHAGDLRYLQVQLGRPPPVLQQSEPSHLPGPPPCDIRVMRALLPRLSADSTALIKSINK
eukprot:1188188-Prorocentrum_minimum.AAC.3